MKKLIAAALTGALVLGTVGTSVVFAADDDKTITVAASETPHSEILEAAKPILEEEGYDLEVTVFDDYVQPNEVVDSGDFDANYFQHAPYMEQFNKEKGTKLVDQYGKEIEIQGCITIPKDVSMDEVIDKFIAFIEKNEWSFGGGYRTIIDGYYMNADGTKGKCVLDE